MLTSPGLFGGYPAPSAYVHNVFGSDVFEQAAAGEAYPVGDVSGEEAALRPFAGEHQLEQDPYTMMIAVKTGDLYLSHRARRRRPRRPAAAAARTRSRRTSPAATCSGAGPSAPTGSRTAKA